MDHHTKNDSNDDNDNNDDNNDDNDNSKSRCNPFIIQKRTFALNADPVYVFKKQIPLDIFYDFIERMGGPPVESSKIMHILKSGCKSTSIDLSNHLFYMVDTIAFKRGLYLNIVKPFMNKVFYIFRLYTTGNDDDCVVGNIISTIKLFNVIQVCCFNMRNIFANRWPLVRVYLIC